MSLVTLQPAASVASSKGGEFMDYAEGDYGAADVNPAGWLESGS
jgi:hypothetical protein